MNAKYYNASAELNLQFCEFLQSHVGFLKATPILLKAIQKTLDDMVQIFETNQTLMNTDVRKAIMSKVKDTTAKLHHASL